MSKLPTLSESTETASQTVRNLLSWLPNPHQCQECGTYCESGVTYDSQLCMPVDAWICPNEECEMEYYRERY